MNANSPVLRLFEVRTRPGCTNDLLQKFASTSADVVRNEPGNLGYFFGRIIEQNDNVVIFASVWRDLAAIQDRFGENWQRSYLPPGYDELIEECRVRHLDLGSSWHVDHLP